MADTYQMVTDRMIEALEQGVCPWQKPWHGGGNVALKYGTQKPYSFLNQMLLGFTGEWAGFNDIKKRGGNVKKGAHAHKVVFWRWVEDEKDEKTGEVITRGYPILKVLPVFQIGVDTEGLDSKQDKPEPLEFNPVEEAEAVAKDYCQRTGVTIRNAYQGQAYYSPDDDAVTLPEPEQFVSVAEYYSAMFHELAHSTGHKSRLNRAMSTHFAGKEYSKEELVAEMASAFSMSRLGIETPDSFRNSAAYLQGWLKALKDDKRLIVQAAGLSEKAVKLMFNDTDDEAA